jgi:hypothetical protein
MSIHMAKSGVCFPVKRSVQKPELQQLRELHFILRKSPSSKLYSPWALQTMWPTSFVKDVWGRGLVTLYPPSSFHFHSLQPPSGNDPDLQSHLSFNHTKTIVQFEVHRLYGHTTRGASDIRKCAQFTDEIHNSVVLEF